MWACPLLQVIISSYVPRWNGSSSALRVAGASISTSASSRDSSRKATRSLRWSSNTGCPQRWVGGLERAQVGCERHLLVHEVPRTLTISPRIQGVRTPNNHRPNSSRTIIYPGAANFLRSPSRTVNVTLIMGTNGIRAGLPQLNQLLWTVVDRGNLD